MKLHLGCGTHVLEGYINIDSSIDLDDVIKENILDLSFIDDDTADEVVAFYLLEHLTYEEVLTLLYQISKKLIVGGLLKVLVPNFDSICEYYQKNKHNVKALGLLSTEVFIFGQEGGHKSLWNREMLGYYLTFEGYYGAPMFIKENVGSRGLGIYIEVARTSEGKYYRQLLMED